MAVKVNSFSHGGNLARAAALYGISEKEFIDFSASINPLGPAPGVYRAITEEMWRIEHYPDPDWGQLPDLLAKHLGVGKENLLLGNGGAELIFTLPGALKIKKALVAAPTFSEYAEAVKAFGGVVEYFSIGREIEGIQHSLSGADAIFICNPNNPTGAVLDRSFLLPVIEWAQEAGVFVIVDEAFMDFVKDRREISLMSEACRRSRLVVLYSMTKFFGIPGLRLGAAVAAPETTAILKRSKDPWSVNVLACAAGQAALRDKEHMEDTLRTVQEERSYLFSELCSIPGVKPIPSAANFLLVDISGAGLSPESLVERMGRQGILVRNCSNFHGLEIPCIRLAVRKRVENETLLRVLKSVIG